MSRKSKVQEAPANEKTAKTRLASLYAVSQRFKHWRPAGEVLTRVKAHPTIFPLVDRATGVDGWPLERIAVVHGPSNHGKTTLCHGLGYSFLRAGDFYALVDAEYTTPKDWVGNLMASEASNPGFVALRPKNYEETVDAVRDFALKIGQARDAGDLPDDATGLIVVDSIKKLVPENLLKNLMDPRKDAGMDGASGRGAMMKAALNSQWMDELVPLMSHAKLSMVIIAREAEQAPDFKRLLDPGSGFDYRITGGKGIVFDASLVARVTRSWVKNGSGDTATIVGERHTVTITKTKVSGKTDKVTKGFFHTSNGVDSPAGFDRARDVLELARDASLIHARGAWMDCPVLGAKWNGEAKALEALRLDEALLDTLEGEARGAGSDAPEYATEEEACRG